MGQVVDLGNQAVFIALFLQVLMEGVHVFGGVVVDGGFDQGLQLVIQHMADCLAVGLVAAVQGQLPHVGQQVGGTGFVQHDVPFSGFLVVILVGAEQGVVVADQLDVHAQEAQSGLDGGDDLGVVVGDVVEQAVGLAGGNARFLKQGLGLFFVILKVFFVGPLVHKVRILGVADGLGVIADAVESKRDDVIHVHGVGDGLTFRSGGDGVVIEGQELGGVVRDLGHVEAFNAHEVGDIRAVDGSGDVDFLGFQSVHHLHGVGNDLEGDLVHVVPGSGGNQFVLLPVIGIALIYDGGAGLIAGNAVGAGGHGVGGHLVSRSFISGLGDDGAFHQQGLQIASGQGGEVEAGDIIGDHVHAGHRGKLRQVAGGLGGFKAELDVAGFQGVAGLVFDVVVDFHIVGQVVHLGQFLHQAAAEFVSVLDHQHFIGGEQDADAAQAHALEGADVAGIAGQADDDGAALFSGSKAGHGENHDQSQNERQELFHEDTFLSFCSSGS